MERRDTGQIPLRRRDDSVRAYALVDAQDYDRVAGRRWALGATGGYVMCWATRTYLHREVMGLASGDRREVDHLNGNKLDCRRENLRVVPPKTNRQNLRSRAGSTSRFRGVCWATRRGKWKAAVMVDGCTVWQEHFEDELDAARAAERVRLERMPGALPTPGLGAA